MRPRQWLLVPDGRDDPWRGDTLLIVSIYLLPTDDRALIRTAMFRMARERLRVDLIKVPGGHKQPRRLPEPIAETIDQATRLPAGTPAPG